MDELSNENKFLREKLQQLEQEKANLLNEKERRDRDCKNMQTELNRMNQMVHVIKNMSGSA
jgi:predicted nuclease with TOPRIM domain